jgi:RNA polymerase II-associated factor 1
MFNLYFINLSQSYSVCVPVLFDHISENTNCLSPLYFPFPRHNTGVSWMRKSEYISAEYNRFIQSAEKAESRVGYQLKKMFKDEDIYKDRDSQIAAIEKTFVDAKLPVEEHFNKPGVYATETLSLYPDFSLWKNPCAQVIFDSDPASKPRPSGQSSTKPSAHTEEMSQAMIRGELWIWEFGWR